MDFLDTAFRKVHDQPEATISYMYFDTSESVEDESWDTGGLDRNPPKDMNRLEVKMGIHNVSLKSMTFSAEYSIEQKQDLIKYHNINIEEQLNAALKYEYRKNLVENLLKEYQENAEKNSRMGFWKRLFYYLNKKSVISEDNVKQHILYMWNNLRESTRMQQGGDVFFVVSRNVADVLIRSNIFQSKEVFTDSPSYPNVQYLGDIKTPQCPVFLDILSDKNYLMGGIMSSYHHPNSYIIETPCDNNIQKAGEVAGIFDVLRPGTEYSKMVLENRVGIGLTPPAKKCYQKVKLRNRLIDIIKKWIKGE